MRFASALSLLIGAGPSSRALATANAVELAAADPDAPAPAGPQGRALRRATGRRAVRAAVGAGPAALLDASALASAVADDPTPSPAALVPQVDQPGCDSPRMIGPLRNWNDVSQCLDVGRTYYCDGFSDQVWQLCEDGSIRNAASRLCLAEATPGGYNVVAKACTENPDKWVETDKKMDIVAISGKEETRFQLKHERTGKCLEVEGRSGKGNVGLWECLADHDMYWTWSTSTTPIEDYLGLRFLKEYEIAAAFDKTEGAVIASNGLVVYDVKGFGANIEQHNSKWLDISYDEFQQMCVTRCHRNAVCAAVTVFKCPCDLKMEPLGLGHNYRCNLIADDVEVRGVKAAQLSDSGMASDTVYVKKGHVFPPVEPCKLDSENLEMSFYCATCMPAQSCDSMGPDLTEKCQTLLSAPSNADFMDKVAPGAGCVAAHGGNAAACLKCTTEKLAGEGYIAGTICTEDDELNLFRGHCKEECKTNTPGSCQAALQKSALCVTGAPLIRNATVWENGLINTPYECPSSV